MNLTTLWTGIINTENSFSTASWSTPNGAGHRLYQGLLYFQNVIHFQCRFLNVFHLCSQEQYSPYTTTVFHETHTTVQLDGVVSIATGYRLDGPGIEFRRWRDFPLPSRPDLRPTPPPTQRCRVPFLAVMQLRCSADRWNNSVHWTHRSLQSSRHTISHSNNIRNYTNAHMFREAWNHIIILYLNII